MNTIHGRTASAAVLALADDVGARVALASGTGRLDDFVGAPGYELWKVLSSGDRSRSRLWVARVRAAPTRRAALRVAVRLVAPNRHRMEASLGRPPLFPPSISTTSWISSQAPPFRKSSTAFCWGSRANPERPCPGVGTRR